MNWKTQLTINQYNARILFSVINKELRRGNVLNSLNVAKELYDSGKEYQIKLWQRLITITAEDVGLGNLSLYGYISNAYFNFLKDNKFEFIHNSIELIGKSQKSRYADEVLNYALLKYLYGKTDYFNSSKHTKPLNEASPEKLKDFISNNNLIDAVGVFISLCLSGFKDELSAWEVLITSIPKWKEELELAYKISIKMKPGKNDRLMAGVLFITGYIMGIEIKQIEKLNQEFSIDSKKPILIPEYALDLHANTTGRELTKGDFKEFWTVGSVLSNEIAFNGNDTYSSEYKKYILNNLEKFHKLYYDRKNIPSDFWTSNFKENE